MTITDKAECCSPTTPMTLAQPISRDDAEQLAIQLKAVADPTRLQLVAFISASKSSEACVCDLTESFDLTQPTISHHLKVLTDAGLVSKEKRGTWSWYSVNQDRWAQLAALFNTTACC